MIQPTMWTGAPSSTAPVRTAPVSPKAVTDAPPLEAPADSVQVAAAPAAGAEPSPAARDLAPPAMSVAKKIAVSLLGVLGFGLSHVSADTIKTSPGATTRAALHAPPPNSAPPPMFTARAASDSVAGPPPDLLLADDPSADVDVPMALLPNGKPVPPDDYGGGFHGTTEVPPEVALTEGLPARGTDMRLHEHTLQTGNSAFRGTTAVVCDPVSENGAAYWAGEGGWVYDIRNVPTWDVNRQLDGRVQSPDGHFHGNIVHGEQERAIPAQVPPENIKRWGQVVETSTGAMVVREWHDNPNFGGV